MDASASPPVDANINGVYGFFLQIENSKFTSPPKHNTVIKYTKLPDFNLDSKVLWPDKNYTLQPRFRRIATIDDTPVVTSRSFKTDLVAPFKTMSSNVTKRKIVTIEEDDENDLHPKFSRDLRKPINLKTSSRAAETEFKNEKQYSQRTTSRLSNCSKYSKEPKSSAKNCNTTFTRKDSTSPKVNYKSKYSNVNQPPTDISRSRNFKDKETIKSKSSNVSSKISLKLSKNLVTPRESEKEVSIIKTKLMESLKTPYKKSVEKTKSPKVSTLPPKKNVTFLKEKGKSKPVTVIHVPLDNGYYKDVENIESKNTLVHPLVQELDSKLDCSTEVEKKMYSKDATTGTDSRITMEDKVTETDNQNGLLCRCANSTNVQAELLKTTFDSLEVPNVTLTKDKNESKEELINSHSKSLPNLQTPPLKVTHSKIEDIKKESNFSQSTSYIIGHATVTCTTRQKINFHVSNMVGNNNETISNQSTSPLIYPMNVVSIFEKEMTKKQLHDNSFEQEDKSNVAYTNCLNELQSLNYSYVLNSNKLVKPSDIISTIRVNNGLLQSDFICEQFQRELNFIDSFFESLQYLESSSLSDKCFSENNVKSLINSTSFDVRNSEYGSFLSKLDNGATLDDNETMASKSLCLLNLLIRDEQRRAKNLLFVLKMREDALKDFTKSQILWLENKKKQENTDISTLKKKQRGALLKLQHECGEMQRMRKALLTQSEKRKVALMKTKKNIELTLTNNVSVDQIILGKKKLKRNTADRNTAPLKCFELSSSGCDENSASKLKCDIPLPGSSITVTSVNSAEKCIQTGDSILDTVQIDESTDTAAENFVVVDGGYLNILFHNLSLPQIFSSGKQYEVNEEALKNILNSANSNHHFSETNVVDRFVNHIKNPDLESSSPSTARSLVEELNQYYKGLIEEDKSPADSPTTDSRFLYDVKETIQTVESKMQQCNNSCLQSASTMTNDSTETIVDLDPFMSQRPCICEISGEVDLLNDEESIPTVTQTGPLPVPAGAAASTDSQGSDASLWDLAKSSSTVITDGSNISNETDSQNDMSLQTIPTPVQCEAEELRRQQLAIEREIKALEQQQCQLLVVREIPDKPPPPYTPPAEARAPRLPRMYVADETTEEKIQKYIRDPNTDSCDPTDPFDTFVKDFCIETLGTQMMERSDKPWDACNLLPQKPQDDTEKLIKKTSTHLLEILTGVPPVNISGVGARRSDHIDDILFAEWRRCEPEWTSLHTDEALVKNQIFESIFQKILTETIDEYKRTVLCDK